MFSQEPFEICCEWGAQGITALAPSCDVVVVVDVLSFSTCVCTAMEHGATVYPFPWRDDRAREFAAENEAELAGSRKTARYNLSPLSVLDIPPGTRLVLPSPNGGNLSLATGTTTTLLGCLRNAKAAAAAASSVGRRIAVIPAGERWDSDETLRPSVEDWIGAGAIIFHLEGTKSPEAGAAQAAYEGAAECLEEALRECGSGRQLIELGYDKDVPFAARLNVSNCVPILREGAYATFGEVDL